MIRLMRYPVCWSLLALGLYSAIAYGQLGAPSPMTSPSPSPSVPQPSATLSPSPSPAPSGAPSAVPSLAIAPQSVSSFEWASLGNEKTLTPLVEKSGGSSPAYSAAYCLGSNRLEVKLIPESKDKKSGAKYQIQSSESLPPKGAQCILVGKDFEDSHQLLKQGATDGNCPAKLEQALSKLGKGDFKFCSVEKKLSDVLAFYFRLGDSEMRYFGISQGELLSFELLGMEETFSLESIEFGPFFKSKDGKIQYLFRSTRDEVGPQFALKEAVTGEPQVLSQAGAFPAAPLPVAQVPAPAPSVTVTGSPVSATSPATETEIELSAFFAKGGDEKYLIPVLGGYGEGDRVFDRKSYNLVAAYCAKSGRHGIAFLKERKPVPGKDVRVESVNTDWSDIPGSIYALTDGKLESGEDGCFVVTQSFEKSHRLLKRSEASGKCPAAIRAAIQKVGAPQSGECNLLEKYEDLLVFTFTKKGQATEYVEAKESAQYVGVFDGRTLYYDESDYPNDKGLLLGPFFKASNGKYRFLLMWRWTSGEGVPWTFTEMKDGSTNNLIEYMNYNEGM